MCFNKRNAFALICLVCLISHGCATTPTARTIPVSVTSSPSGATIYLQDFIGADKIYVGKTPCTVMVPLEQWKYTLKAELDGYREAYFGFSRTPITIYHFTLEEDVLVKTRREWQQMWGYGQYSGSSTKEISGTPVSIDLTSNQLPSNFTGDNPIATYNMLGKELYKKSEFDTHQQFEGKIESDPEMNKVYAFQMENTFPQFAKYDAEQSTINVVVPIEPVESYMMSGIRNICVVKTITKGTRDTIEGNAFGAIARVTTTRGERYAIALANEYEIAEKKDRRKSVLVEPPILLVYEIHIANIPPETAREIVPNLKLLAICKPVCGGKDSSVTFRTLEYTQATLDNPYRHSFWINCVRVRLYQVWVYDFRTGRVIYKHNCE